MENNLADKEDEYLFKDEKSIIELANRIMESYERLTISDEKKSEMRAYCVSGANTFNKKFSEDYDYIYIDNYLEFINSSDFDDSDSETESTITEIYKNENTCHVCDNSKNDCACPICSKCEDLLIDCVCDSESESEEEEKDEAEQFIKDTGICRVYFNSFNSKNETDDEDSDSDDEEKDECNNCYEKINNCLCNIDLFREVKALRNELEAKNILVERLEEKTNNQYDRMKKIEQTYIDKIKELKEQNEENTSKIKFLEALREQDNSIINQYIQLNDKKDKIIDKKNIEIFYYESKVREMNEHTKLNNN
jgi:hypothetical protein